jgi:hypothetical protein
VRVARLLLRLRDDQNGERDRVSYDPTMEPGDEVDVDGEPTAVDAEPEEVPPAVCPTCGRPFGDGGTYTPGAGNIW